MVGLDDAAVFGGDVREGEDLVGGNELVSVGKEVIGRRRKRGRRGGEEHTGTSKHSLLCSRCMEILITRMMDLISPTLRCSEGFGCSGSGGSVWVARSRMTWGWVWSVHSRTSETFHLWGRVSRWRRVNSSR